MPGHPMMSTSGEPRETTFVVPAGLTGPSGGTAYNEALTRALRAAGGTVSVCGVGGRWPRPGQSDLHELRATLAGRAQVVLDGIIASAAPAEVEAAVAGGTRVHVLFHLSLLAEGSVPPADRARVEARERRALQAAHTVICTSEWAAGDVVARYGLLPTRVVPPGTDPAPLARGSNPPQLLVLASLTSRKNQLTLLDALSALESLPWRAMLVGPGAAEPAYARRVRQHAASAFAPGRVHVTGPRTGPELDAIWAATDLLLLVSREETFGMVVTEALARGIPAIVGAGTGSEEALAVGGGSLPGAAAAPNDPVGLEAVLRSWLQDPARRNSWRNAAILARDRMPTWHDAAIDMLRILGP